MYRLVRLSKKTYTKKVTLTKVATLRLRKSNEIHRKHDFCRVDSSLAAQVGMALGAGVCLGL
jgi:hypothetical protein